MTPQNLDNPPDSPRSDSGTGTGAQVGRRRLLRGGLATGPVLLTMVSRPVMAAPTCFPGSVSYSANQSNARPGVTCSGLAPGTWSQPSSFGNWPSPMASPGPVVVAAVAVAVAEPASSAKAGPATTAGPSTLVDAVPAKDEKGTSKVTATTFNSVFGNSSGYDRKTTLLEVLSLNTSKGRDGLASHLAAAYLNALKGLTPASVLDVPTVKDIWTSFVARGYYEPTAGIRWYPDYAEPANPRGGVIAWLKTTMPY